MKTGDTLDICGTKFEAGNTADMIKKVSEYSSKGGLCPQIVVEVGCFEGIGNYHCMMNATSTSIIIPTVFKKRGIGDGQIGFTVKSEGALTKFVSMTVDQAKTFIAGMQEIVDRKTLVPHDEKAQTLTFVEK